MKNQSIMEIFMYQDLLMACDNLSKDLDAVDPELLWNILIKFMFSRKFVNI